jgi:hypothetical protein
MGGTFPLGSAGGPVDANEVVQRMDRNLQELLRWVKLLVGLLGVLIVINVLFLV